MPVSNYCRWYNLSLGIAYSFIQSSSMTGPGPGPGVRKSFMLRLSSNLMLRMWWLVKRSEFARVRTQPSDAAYICESSMPCSFALGLAPQRRAAYAAPGSSLTNSGGLVIRESLLAQASRAFRFSCSYSWTS